MIIVDLSQVCISNLMMTFKGKMSQDDIEVGLLRHFILNSIRSYNMKYKAEYGEMIIACDHPHSWRKSVFPYYKANRKKNREESTIDWKTVFEAIAQIRSEIKEFFPYRTIMVEGAEADDIIGTLCHKFGSPLASGEPILILSGDRDFGQLQTFGNVSQYDPVRKKKIQVNDPTAYLKEHIIRGDKSDGVPNVLSDDDQLVLGTRAATLSKKRMDSLMNEPITDEKTLRNFRRNEELIDLAFTPKFIQDEILNEYEKEAGKGRSHLMNYFIKNKLKNLMEQITDF